MKAMSSNFGGQSRLWWVLRLAKMHYFVLGHVQVLWQIKPEPHVVKRHTLPQCVMVNTLLVQLCMSIYEDCHFICSYLAGGYSFNAWSWEQLWYNSMDMKTSDSKWWSQANRKSRVMNSKVCAVSLGPWNKQQFWHNWSHMAFSTEIFCLAEF